MKPKPFRPDIVWEHPNGAALVVEVKSRPIDLDDRSRLVTSLQRYLREAGYAEAGYGLLVDPEFVRFYGASRSDELASLATDDVLKTLDPRLDENSMYESYLETLINIWLNELAVTPIDQLPSVLAPLPGDLRRILAAT